MTLKSSVRNAICTPCADILHVDVVWRIAELLRTDCDTRKIMVENGAKQPLGSTELLHLVGG